MPGATRVSQDSAGATIIGPGATNVFVNSKPLSLVGDKVTPHNPTPPTPNPHWPAPPTMVGHSSTVFANGKPVVRAGDSASCGHSANGSSNVFIG